MRRIIVAIAVLSISIFCRNADAGILLPKKVVNQQEKAQAKQPLQGKIVFVDRPKMTVWINLGQGDGLKPHEVIPVMRQSDDEAIKARIEVVRLLGKHLSEARILSEPQDDPIGRGDPVFP